MADDFGAFSSAFSQPSQKEDRHESAWALWPAFQEEPPPIDDFDEEDDDEFGTFASASNTVTSLESGNSEASVSTPDSTLPPLPNGGWPRSSMLSTPVPGVSASEDLNIDELAKEIDAISQGISLTLPVSGTQYSEDGLSFMTSESSTLQDLDISEPLGLAHSELPVIPADDDFGGFVSPPVMSVAQDLQLGSDAVPMGALPNQQIGNGTFLDDLGSGRVCTSEVKGKTRVGCNEYSLEEDLVSRSNVCEPALQPPEDDFGDFESMQQPPEEDFKPSQHPPEEDFGDFGSSQHPPEEDFGEFGSSQRPPEEDFGDFGSSQHPPEEDFGDFGSSQRPPEEDFGDFGSSQRPPEEGFGDFGSSQRPPEEGFGDFGSSQRPPEGDFGSSQCAPEDDFGDFGSAAPTQANNSGDFSAAPNTVQEEFGNFSSASTSNLNSTKTTVSTPKPSTSLPAKEAILDLLDQCFPSSPPCGPAKPSPGELHKQALTSGLWQAYRGSRDVSATTKVYRWEYSDIQDKFYYSAHVDPAMAPAMSTQQFKSALQMEDFSLLLTANKESSSSPMSSPPGTPTQLTSVLLDLSFQSAESARSPPQSDSKEMVTLDADLLGLDLTATVQESISDNMGMGLESSLQLGETLAATKDDAASSQGEVDDSFSSFVHATPPHPSHQEPAVTVHASYLTAAGNEDDEDEFTSFSSAEPSSAPFPPFTQPTITFDLFGGTIPSISTTTDLEASEDIFSDITSALPPVTPSSDLTLPSGASGSRSLFANPSTLPASSFANFSQLAKTAGVFSGATSYSSNGSVPTSENSSIFPAVPAPSCNPPASTPAGTMTISSPEPLTAQAQQLFDRIPDVRFMLSNVLLSPKSFL